MNPYDDEQEAPPTGEKVVRISLDVDLTPELGSQVLAERITSQVTERVLVNGSGLGEEARTYHHDAIRRIRALADEEIRAQLAPIVTEALEEWLQPVDEFGEPTGPRKRMREMVKNNITDLGKRPSSGYADRESTLDKLLKEQVEKAMVRELKPVIDEAKQLVKKAVQDKGAEMLAQTVQALTREVRS